MRRGMWMAVALLVILVGIAAGVGAYNAGLNEGLETSSRGVEVVRVVDRDGFFPFGLILFPLFLIGIFALVRGIFWRGRWGGPGPGHWGPGAWAREGPAMFEEWHKRQHESPGEQQRGGSEPASV